MKRISLLGLVLCVVLMGVFMGCKNKKGELTEPEQEEEQQQPELTGFENGHEWVDLGLPSSLLWATMNVGANAEEEYGNYYAWGEIAPKIDYSWATYKYANGDYNKLTKYCNDASKGNNGYTDELAVLELTDDAAHANWGGNWRMPTNNEVKELLYTCTWTWVTYKGFNGCKVTGRNKKSIFLPATGYLRGTELYSRDSYGNYQSSTLSSSGPCYVFFFGFGSEEDNHGWSEFYRYYGRSVRAVCEKN